MHYDALLRVIAQGVEALMERQRADGAFDFCCEVNPLPDAMMALCLRLMGAQADTAGPSACTPGHAPVDAPVHTPSVWSASSPVDPLVEALCRRIESLQDEDGAWRAYPDQPDNPSATALAYATLLLCGRAPDDPAMQRARDYLVRHGGLDAVSHMTKILLATAGQYPWNRLPGEHIDFALLGPGAPLSLYDFSSYARVHMPSFMILRHLRHRFPVPPHPGIVSLLAPPRDLPALRTRFRHTRAIQRCRVWILDRLEPNGTLASYVTATVLAVFALAAVGDERDVPVIQRALEGMQEMVRPLDGTLHQQVFTSTVWDTALALHALISARDALRSAGRPGSVPADLQILWRKPIFGGPRSISRRANRTFPPTGACMRHPCSRVAGVFPMSTPGTPTLTTRPPPYRRCIPTAAMCGRCGSRAYDGSSGCRTRTAVGARSSGIPGSAGWSGCPSTTWARR
ncbi:MAG: hypothetical protein K6T81_01570 [Alicyclobacillus macrosporangiidus]|nr:hypothetical protein [Alicyclobacillus macrosporangiidus]